MAYCTAMYTVSYRQTLLRSFITNATDLSVMRSTVSPDAEEVKWLLYQICDQREDAESIKPILAQLGKASNPMFTMNLLAPSVFLGESNAAFEMNHAGALSVVFLLALLDGPTYLKPASRAIKSFAELLASSSTEQTILISDDLLSVLVAQLSGTDVEVSSNATATIKACCRRLGPPLSDRAIRFIVDSWRQTWERTDNRQEATTICVRCASAVVELACLEDAAMGTAINSGATDLLVTMMTDVSDPLLQMSSMDLVEQLTNTIPMHSSRARWLFSRNVLQPLLQMAGAGGDDPDPVLGGPALRVLSAMCRLAHRDASLFGLGGNELLTGFHHALRNFNSSGELERLALIDAISSFASASPDALEAILEDSEIRESWLSLSVAQPKLKSAILKSVALVIDPVPETDANGDSIMMTVLSNESAMKLYSTLGLVNNRDATQLVLSLAKSPFVETRLGAYALLEAVAKQGTGAQVLLSHEGFYDFLISRESESIKEGKEAKFAIIQAIMDSPARGLLADNIVNTLDRILKQGPHYMKAVQEELMTE